MATTSRCRSHATLDSIIRRRHKNAVLHKLWRHLVVELRTRRLPAPQVTVQKDTLSSSKVSFSEDENKERGNWSGRLDFLLSCIGYAVGFGNVWRFPYLCYRNGGGAFLIPYTLMLALAGLPLFFMELAFGQYASLSPITIWKLSPFFKGIGYSMVLISSLVSIYYNVILGYVIFYFVASMRSQVPWANCDNWWNTHACTKRSTDGMNGQVNATWPNDTWLTSVAPIGKPKSPAEEYWERYVLDQSDGIDDLGGVRWQLALSLLAAWVIVFFCLIKGIKSTGKVVYFTATFPYVVLTILLVRGVTLPGAWDGIKFYIIPTFSKLGTARVWGDAAVQIFYSLGPGWGGLITMASYNRFHNNCLRDSIIVSVVNCGTSVYAGIVIFSVIGFLSHELDLPVQNATASGPGLAFVAYPEGLSRMPGAPFWSVMFFFMLITLGLDSMFTGMETVISAVADEYPDRIRPNKTLFTLVLCVVFYLLGLPQVTRGGIYVMHLMDWYCAGFSLLTVAFFEVTVIMYIYGHKRFAGDIRSMIGVTPNIYWKVCWLGITPALIVFVIIFHGLSSERIYYNDYQYPVWADTLGWLMMTFTIVPIPLLMIISFGRHVGSFKKLPFYLSCPWTGETIRRLTAPQVDWGPALKENWSRRHQGALSDRPRSKTTYAYDNPVMAFDNVMYESHV